MKSEKEKMLAGELYDPLDRAQAARFRSRFSLLELLLYLAQRVLTSMPRRSAGIER